MTTKQSLPNEPELGLSGQGLDRQLSTKSIAFRLCLLDIDDGPWASRAGELGPLTCVVFEQACFGIQGNSGVELVGDCASEDVDVPHGSLD